MRKIGKYIAVFVGLIVLYLLFGLVSGLVSDKAVERHVRQTVEQDDLKADFWFAFLYKPNYYMDNFTDALIVNQALCLDGRADTLNYWQRMMLVPRQRGYDNGQEESCDNLRRMTEGDATLRTIYYPRYWHGSTFLMRFLLAIDDYVVLRTLFYILSSLLLMWVLIALARRIGVWIAVIYGLSLTIVDVFMMQFSIQFLPVLVLTLAGTLWILYKKDGKLGIPFLVIGSLTAYFDLLTAPLMTWGMPVLVAMFCWNGERRTESGERLVVRLLPSLFWFVGYVGTWVTKWLLATLTTPMNVFSDAAGQASLRSGVEDYTRWDAVTRNMDLVPWLYVTIAVVVLVMLAVRHFRKGTGITNPLKQIANPLKQALLCFAVALTPLVWYMAMGNHSYLHHWFTYRSLAVTVMGLLLAVASLVDREKLTTHRLPLNTLP